jgi:hypothetical protein
MWILLVGDSTVYMWAAFLIIRKNSCLHLRGEVTTTWSTGLLVIASLLKLYGKEVQCAAMQPISQITHNLFEVKGRMRIVQ